MNSSSTIQQRPINHKSVQNLKQQGASPLLARLLATRGITNIHESQPTMHSLFPPDTLKGMNDAIRLLAHAFKHRHSVAVFGDYDCDGATASALAVKALRRLNIPVHYWVPNRETMGYGLSPEIAKMALIQKPALAITVDNGIASHEGVNLLREHGTKVLITDHHLPGETLPKADAIVNPNQPGCPFPSKHLAGVGVMFYVLIAFRQYLRIHHETDFPLGHYLDLVALGTIADLVPLDANNRCLIHFGLKRMREQRACPGINALIKVTDRKYSMISSTDLGFQLGPRINAAGRIADMTIGIECLLAESMEKAMPLAEQLNRINSTRKNIENHIKNEAMQILTQLDLSNDAWAITLYQAQWHLGIIGIVAARVKENTGKPTFIFARDSQGLLRGSGRSIAGVHLRDCLDWMAKRYPNLLIRFGGHAMAAGASIEEKSLEIFREAFTNATQTLYPEVLDHSIITDGTLQANDFTLANLRMIESVVWGQGFPAPLFHDRFFIDRWKHLKDRHWKLSVHNERIRASALYFNAPETFTPDPSLREVCFTYTLLCNEYQGITDISLRIEHWIGAA